MATNFPTALDDLVGNQSVSDGVTVLEAAAHNTAWDAIDALQEKVGIDGSATTSSHDYLLSKAMIGYIKVIDSKADGVDGQSIPATTWTKRDLTTESNDTESLCSLASSQITLAANTYYCRIWCPVSGTNQFVSQLYNTTDASTTLLGTAGDGTAGIATFPGWIVGQFTIAASKTFEIRTYTSDVGSTGVDVGAGVNNIYTVAEFWRIGS